MNKPLLLLLLALLLGTATSLIRGSPPEVAEAHALLVRADPPVNSQVREAPTTLTLFFSEALERKFSSIRVLDASGQRVDNSVSFDESDPAVMRVELKAVSAGFLVVNWENVSAVDGHRITGSYPLTVLNPDGTPPAGEPPGGSAQVSGEEAEPTRITVRWSLLISAALLTGALAFMAYVSRSLTPSGNEVVIERLDRVAVSLGLGLLAVLMLVGGLELILQSGNINASLSSTLDTRWGQRWLLRHILLVLPLAALVTSFIRPRYRHDVALVGLAGMVGYMALVASVSHAAAGNGAFWATASDFVHLLASSVWIGMLALLILLFTLSRRTERIERFALQATALQRFSTVAVVSLSLLLFTGTVNAVIEVGRLSDMLNTAYGRVLTVKLLLVVSLLLLAAVNAYLLRPRFIYFFEEGRRFREENLASIERQLARGIRWELAMAVAVLLAVAVLVQMTPTRGAAGSDDSTGKFIANQRADDISITLVVDPNQPGTNTFEVYLAGGASNVERVRLDITPLGRPDEESRLIMDASNFPTFYVGTGPFLPQAGKWSIVVDLRRLQGDDLRVPFEVRVPVVGGASEGTTNSDFDAPFSLSAESIALILTSGLLAVAIIVVSQPRPGLPGGLAGEIAEAVVDIVQPRLRSSWSLGALLIVGIGLGLVLGSHAHTRLTREEAASISNPVSPSEESIARGMELFSRNCIQCHGESGRGDGVLAETLPLRPANFYDHIPYHPDQFFFNVITEGLNEYMPAFGETLSAEDRWHIINFLRDRFGNPDPATQ